MLCYVPPPPPPIPAIYTPKLDDCDVANYIHIDGTLHSLGQCFQITAVPLLHCNFPLNFNDHLDTQKRRGWCKAFVLLVR